MANVLTFRPNEQVQLKLSSLDIPEEGIKGVWAVFELTNEFPGDKQVVFSKTFTTPFKGSEMVLDGYLSLPDPPDTHLGTYYCKYINFEKADGNYSLQTMTEPRPAFAITKNSPAGGDVKANQVNVLGVKGL